MTKKTIILFLIVLLILNTLFWINILAQSIPKSTTWKSLGGEMKTQEYTYSERLARALINWGLLKGTITLLVITDVVLIAMSFMIILLYKKE